MQHCGSVRHDSGRQTVRWDLLDPASLDTMLGAAETAGYRPFLVVDPDEDVEFRKRFAPASQRALSRMVHVARIGRVQVYTFREE